MQRAPMCVIVLCGLPGSGKTTLATKLVYHVKSLDNHQACAICFDDLVTPANREHEQSDSRLAPFSPAAWKDGRQAGLAAVEQLLQGGMAQTGSVHQLFVVDDTMHYRSMRHACYQLARKYGAAYLQLHLRCPIEQAIQWNKRRPSAQQVPDEVIRSTAAILENPSSSPLRWESDTLVVDAVTDASMGTASLWGRVWEAWGPPIPPLASGRELLEQQQEARRATSESLLHQLDLACRRQVTECLRQAGDAGPGRQQRAELAKRLSELKGSVLLEAREAELACEKLDGKSSSDAQSGCSRGRVAHTVETGGVPSGIDGCSCTGGDAECDVLSPWVERFRSQCDAVLAKMLCQGPGEAPG